MSAAGASDPTSARPAILATHVTAGALAGVGVAVLDLVHAGLSPAGTRVSPLEFLVAGLHVLALYAPIGVGIGVGTGVVSVALRRARWLGPLRTVLSSPERWVVRDREAFGAALSFFATAGLLVLAGDRAFDFVRAGVHREVLAGYAIGGIVAAALPVGVLLHALLTPLFSAAGWLLGRLATLATALSAVLVVGLVILVNVLRHDHDVAIAYPPVVIASVPTAIVLYVVAVALAHRFLERRTHRGVVTAVTLAVVVPLFALFVSAATYGRSNRVRSVVEQRSLLGRRMVRLYASLADGDGDRHPWAFGGGDCDDGDADVYPGARDDEGDGIDADCFAGDGSPDVAPRGDGDYGTVPEGLGRPNFVVVTIDALRRDHLASNGYGRDTSPELDAFLATAVEFEGVVPQSSRSIRSIPSLWSGLYPSEIAFGDEYLWPSLGPTNVTAAEMLRDHGYETTSVMGTDYFERLDGFFQGFEERVMATSMIPSREWAMDQALPRLGELARGSRPFLLWVHLFNCHAPYLHDGTPSRYGPEQIDFYDTEIGFAGVQFQRLLTEMRHLGLEENTIVVLASDHGEGFGEHGSFTHSTTLYEEEMVPILAVRVPGVATGSVPDVVGLLDVMPTITNLASLPIEMPISGRSLVPAITHERPLDPDRTVFAELMPDGLAPYDIKVARRGHEKLLWWVREGRIQYFDLESDPGELDDLSDDRREDATALLGELRAWVARTNRPENTPEGYIRLNRLAGPPRHMSHPMDLRFERLFTVLGFDLGPGPFYPGGTIPLTFYYRVDAATDRDFQFMVDIFGPGGVALPAHFHAWHFPLHSRYHTDEWRAGEYLRDPTPIVIPEDIHVPVRLRLVLSVRDDGVPVTGVRDGAAGTDFDLASFDVLPRPTDATPVPPPPTTPDAGSSTN